MIGDYNWHIHVPCFPSSSAGKESACNAGDPDSIPGLGRSPGKGNSYPLQYSGLENSMDYSCKESDTTERLWKKNCITKMGFPGGASVKEPTCQCKRCKWYRFNLWVGQIPWRREWLPTPVFLPGESHGQRSLMGYSPWSCTELTRPKGLSRRAGQERSFGGKTQVPEKLTEERAILDSEFWGGFFLDMVFQQRREGKEWASRISGSKVQRVTMICGTLTCSSSGGNHFSNPSLKKKKKSSLRVKCSQICADFRRRADCLGSNF